MKIGHGTALTAGTLLLGATSPALAASALAQVGFERPSPALSVRSQPGVLNLSLSAFATPLIAQHRAQHFDESGKALIGLYYGFVRTGPIGANAEGRSRVAFTIHWQQDYPPIVSPKVASLARNFRHNGLPIVHLWQSGRNLLAIGLNPHGKPGIYFTQQMD